MQTIKCPMCAISLDDPDAHFEIVSGTFRATRMPLTLDGFAFTDAKNVDTEDEIARCCTCNQTAPLGAFSVDQESS